MAQLCTANQYGLHDVRNQRRLLTRPFLCFLQQPRTVDSPLHNLKGVSQIVGNQTSMISVVPALQLIRGFGFCFRERLLGSR